MPEVYDYAQYSNSNVISTGTGSGLIWGQWNQVGAYQYVVPITNQVWYDWNNQTLPGIAIYEVTPEERARAEAAGLQRQEDDRRRWREQDEQRKVARARGLRLLRDVLTAEQRAEMEEKAQFHCTSDRGRRYRIRCEGQAGNVAWVDTIGRVLGEFCAHPHGVPNEDAWLAQFLQIENDEEGFHRVANIVSGRRPQLEEAA